MARRRPGQLIVTVVDSEASNNANVGVFAVSSSGFAKTNVMLRNFVASNNVVGLDAASAAILVAHSVVTGNGTGVTRSGSGAIFTYGDNDIVVNVNDNLGALTTIPMH